MSVRGFYGIAVYHPKTVTNVGTLWRTAHILDAAFLAVIGKRYSHQCSDTLRTPRHIPLFNYQSFDDFRQNGLPLGCKLVGIELDPKASLLKEYKHPTQAVYLLGAEDHGLPPDVMNQCHDLIKLPGEFSMNVAVAGSIIMYDRVTKGERS